MNNKVNLFEEAAENASSRVRTEYAPLLATYRVAISESSARKVTQIIADSFSGLHATFEKLVELVELMKQIDEQYDPFKERYVGINNATANKVGRLLNDPLITAIINRPKEIPKVESDRYEDRHDIHEASFGVDDEGDR